MRFILSKSSQPCIMCGKLTIHVDIYSESHVCGYKCAKMLDEKISKYESEGEVIWIRKIKKLLLY